MKSMAKNKASDGAGIVVEMLQNAGGTLLSIIADLFNEVLQQDTDPVQWKETKVKVLFKKGDTKSLENYRPIAIIPILYKLFSRVLNERLKDVLNDQQAPDQAGFRASYGCDDHLFVLTVSYERCLEWQQPLWLAAVDFKKAFDCVDHDAIWRSLHELGVCPGYTEVLKKLYGRQEGRVVADKTSNKFEINKGTKQGDPISPALFNAVLEILMRRLKQKWAAKGWGVRIGGPGSRLALQNLRFADDVLLTGTTLGQVHSMLQDLSIEAAETA